MSASRMEYLERFLDCVDFVIAGMRNAISSDRWLVNNYDRSFYGAVSKHLKNSDERVRADIVNLLAAVGERGALDTVREMRSSDKNVVKTACLGYLSAMNESDTMVPELFDVLEHKDGPEFMRAAAKLRNVVRSEDVPRLRKLYGRVSGEMREEIKKILVAVIDRDAELGRKRELLLSLPVYPDERKFLSFLETGTTYLDIRYRDSVASRDTISTGTYSNVYAAIMRMRVRMFNEFDNLVHYGPACRKMYDELIRLIEWASCDLSSKAVEKDRTVRSGCPKCGTEMRCFNGIWTCIECGTKK